MPIPEKIGPMTNETPQTIRLWQDEKFPNACRAARIIKTKGEMLELERAILTGDRKAQLEECANVAITVCGWLCNDELLDSWGEFQRTDWPHWSWQDLNKHAQNPWDIGLLRALFSFVAHFKLGDLSAAINAKMVINRARVWDIGADGTGQHVDPDEHFEAGADHGYEVGQAVMADRLKAVEAERDALAQTVERVRKWADAIEALPDLPDDAEDYSQGSRCAWEYAARDILAILDNKER